MTPIEFTDEELKAFRADYCKGATDTQFELFISECKARALRPGPHVVFQIRSAQEYDADTNTKRYVKKAFWITTIGALRLIALRTGKYAGLSSPEFIYLDDEGNPSVLSVIPLPDRKNKGLPREPWAVRVSVKRKDFDEPVTSIVRFESVASTYKSGGSVVLTDMWVKRGPEQNAKCAEADALRKAFPEELGSLYLAEEIKDEEQPTPQAVTPASVVPLPPPVPAVNQTPAQGTEAPRPGETTAEYHVTSVPATLPPHSGSVLRVVPNDGATTPTETGNAAYADKMTPEEVSQHSQTLAKKEVKVEVSPEPVVSATVETPASAEKKRARKPKEETRPEAGGITDEDLEAIGTPAPVVDEEQIKRETDEFIEAIDPTPTKEEQHGFTARVRALSAAGAKSEDLKNYILSVGKKSDTKQLTVRDWKQALEQLEAAQTDGKLVEVSKAAPLPTF